MEFVKQKHYEHLLKKSKSLTKKDVLSIPELKDNPISVILIKKYVECEKFDGEKFIKDLLDFCLAKTTDEKLKFIFSVYDLDGDNFISSLDLFDILKTLNKGILDDWKIQNVVDKTFAEIGEYRSKLSFDQFKFIIEKKMLGSLKIF